MPAGLSLWQSSQARVGDRIRNGNAQSRISLFQYLLRDLRPVWDMFCSDLAFFSFSR